MTQWIPSIFWISIGIYVAIQAYLLGLGSFHQPGPGFIFFLAALILTFLSVIDLIATFMARSEEKEKRIWWGVQWERVLLILGVLSAYVFFWNVLGFLISTFLLMIFLFKGIEPTRWWIALVGGFITTLMAYYIFKVWLAIPFPRGFLGV
ncbi:MAG: tripartite tricarboxylate transporter TctB family protein [Deltaproteobacteria bacterium]|nr:tripartite tricarboxylate transporter TctB family protein [Deltaproteobacteria bacterium]